MSYVTFIWLLTLTLLTYAHTDLNRRTSKAKFFTQTSLNKAPIAWVQETGSKQHYARRGHLHLRPKQDAWLFTSTQRVRGSSLLLP